MAFLQDLINNNPLPDALDTPASTGSGSGVFHTGITTQAAANPQTLIFNIAVILTWALGIAAVIVILYSGFQYMTAGGEPDKAEGAKKTLIGAIIGLVLVLGSYVIFNVAVDAINPGTSTPAQILNKTYH